MNEDGGLVSNITGANEEETTAYVSLATQHTQITCQWGEDLNAEREWSELLDRCIGEQVQAGARSHLTPTGMTTRKKQTAGNAGEDVGKLEAWVLLMGMQRGPAARKNSMAFLQKVSLKLPSGPAIPLLGLNPKELEAGDKCAPVSIATLFTIEERWEQPRCP